jgi:ABC-type uncharacterized transport system involved in gliding motility auxiliary subunit
MKPGLKALAAALLLAGLVLVNFLAARLPLRLDATAGRVYTLTPGTRAILAAINEPITLDLYITRDSDLPLPAQYANFADQVREMLRQYARASGGKLVLNLIAPQPDTLEEEAAARAGLTPLNNPESGAPAFYFGLVATQADQRQAIQAFRLEREQLLEYDLSLLIHSVQHHQDAKKKLGLITSLPLQGTNPQDMQLMMMLQQRPQRGQVIASVWGNGYALQSVAPDADQLPVGLDALAIIHPQNLSPKLQFAIDQFLLSGKPVLLALDPSSQYFKRQAGQQQQLMMMGGGAPNVSSDLPLLLKAWGVGYRSDFVIGDLNRATKVGGPRGGVLLLPTWLSLDADDVSRDSAAIAHLKSFLFVESGSLDLNPTPSVVATPLIQTTDQAGEIPAALLQMSSGEDAAGKLTAPGKRTLAALLRGKFVTAFPDGAPKDDKPADPAAAKPEEKKDPVPAVALKESAAASTLVVVADTDWLFDDYIFDGRDMQIAMQLGVMPATINDNLDLAANLVDFLAGSPELMSIRGKGPSYRPFKVVQRMEADARKKFEAKLAELEASLSEVQQKISGMTAKRAEGGRLVASPEMQAEIEKFRQDEVAIRRQQREIKRQLREDIDALGRRLLWANLLATPLLVGAFGLWFRQRRRQA